MGSHQARTEVQRVGQDHRAVAQRRQDLTADRTYKNRLDGYDQMAAITGKGPSARHKMSYLGEGRDDSEFRFIEPQGLVKDPSGRALHHQPASGSVRAHGLAQQRDKGWVPAILRLVQVPILVFVFVQQVMAKEIQTFLDYPPITRRELQPGRPESGDGETDARGGGGQQRPQRLGRSLSLRCGGEGRLHGPSANLTVLALSAFLQRMVGLSQIIRYANTGKPRYSSLGTAIAR